MFCALAHHTIQIMFAVNCKIFLNLVLRLVFNLLCVYSTLHYILTTQKYVKMQMHNKDENLLTWLGSHTHVYMHYVCIFKCKKDYYLKNKVVLVI